LKINRKRVWTLSGILAVFNWLVTATPLKGAMPLIHFIKVEQEVDSLSCRKFTVKYLETTSCKVNVEHLIVSFVILVKDRFIHIWINWKVIVYIEGREQVAEEVDCFLFLYILIMKYKKKEHRTCHSSMVALFNMSELPFSIILVHMKLCKIILHVVAFSMSLSTYLQK